MTGGAERIFAAASNSLDSPSGDSYMEEQRVKLHAARFPTLNRNERQTTRRSRMAKKAKKSEKKPMKKGK
jgi:hypothetical protein